ncbi:interleukin-4 receptor subunit alpha [Zootoca vivipara]|uniref:interleukin-4 receptor subunit alpha n=1 Tax=Zootoca vivipara TaxID=8524 RepID=UPI00293BA6E1|nr:interleukin-4 receptor subunit alpha [Zootoca vivipara]
MLFKQEEDQGATQRFPDSSRGSGGCVAQGGWSRRVAKGSPSPSGSLALPSHALSPPGFPFASGRSAGWNPGGGGTRRALAEFALSSSPPTKRSSPSPKQAAAAGALGLRAARPSQAGLADGCLLSSALLGSAPGGRAGTGRRREAGRSTVPLPGRARRTLFPTLRMADGGTGFGGPRRKPCLLLSVFLVCSLWHNVSSKDIQPSCLTDYESEVVCHWEVDASTDCPKEFLLRVATTHALYGPGPSWVCSPKNKRGLDVTPKCTCSIRSEVLRTYKYHFSLEAEKEIWKKSVDPDDIVKPRPLVNLTVKRTDDSYIFTWADDYKEGNLLHENPETVYEVAYWPINQTEKIHEHITQGFHHKIFDDNLMPGATYVAKVRQRIALFGDTWSDWSAEYTWKNDIEPSSGSFLWIFIPLLCVFIMALATFSFFCVTRVKKGWWDQIPNPAKSKVAAGVTAAVAPFGNVGLEHPVHIHSCIASAKSETRKEEDCQVPHEDAVAKLFRDLLSGDLSSGGTGILDEHPLLKDQALGHMQSVFSFSQDAPLDKHRGVLETSSEPVYHNTSTETVASSQPSSAALELPLSTATPQPSGYKCFSSLVAEPMAAFSQVCEEEEQEFSPFRDQIQPFSHDAGPCLAPVTSNLHPAFQGIFPEGSDSLCFSSCMAAAEREVRPGSPSQHGPGKSGPGPVASLLAGYRSFSSALQGGTAPQGKSGSAGSRLDRQSPYKPLLSIVQNSPAAATGVSRVLFHPGWGAQEVRDPAWPSAPCGADLDMQQVASNGCFREDVARDKGLSYP